MSKLPESLNDKAWKLLFSKYNILDQIDANGRFEISAAQIKKFREPRLMAKFDHAINLPKIFADHQLSILPITRGDYVISHFEAYHEFKDDSNLPIIRVPLPSYIQSLDPKSITSETVALNCAVAAGIISEFLEDEDLVSTVSGRMSSGSFEFDIDNSRTKTSSHVQVRNSQIEIDAAYEGVRALTIFEAKRDLSDDFLGRQLYYPFRAWRCRVKKPVRTVFLVYSNGIYRLYEYIFQEVNNYSSLVLVRQKNYSVEDTTIEITDIQGILQSVRIVSEPKVPFPQADSFERVINICELLNEQNLSRSDVTEQYAFDVRQTNYYTDAARYLGLLEKQTDGNIPIYGLSEAGKRVLHLGYKQRQLAFCNLILSHEAFNQTLRKHLETGEMPTKGEIVQIMRSSNLYQVESQTTYERRSSTIRGWINWILGLING
jgi:hypothetical protein